MKKVDRAINNKTDFFQNRRNPDIQAKFLVESLTSFGYVGKNLFNSFPLQMIFIDQKITDEQSKIFLDRFNFKHIDESLRFFEIKKFESVRNKLSFFYQLNLINKTNYFYLFIFLIFKNIF